MDVSGVLRVIVGAFGALLVATALLLFVAGGQVALSGIYPLVIGVVAIATALFEQARYGRARQPAAGNGLRPTEERFVDPTTGELTRVWIDPASGERTYLPDEVGRG